MFVIQADKSKLSIVESEILVANAVDVYPIRFTFSTDWDGFGKVAIFYNDAHEYNRYSVLIDDSGMVSIPYEVLKDVDAILYVGVCGDGAPAKHLPTLITSLGRIRQGICGPATESQDPEVSIYQQILIELNGIRRDIEQGMLVGPEGPRGAKGEQGLKGDPGPQGPSGTDGKSVDADEVINTLKQYINSKIKELIPIDQNTLSFASGSLSVKKDIIVRSTDKSTFNSMSADDKMGLIIVMDET